MRIIDTHCDLLSRLLAEPGASFIRETPGIDVNLPRLRKAGIAVQFLALYLSETLRNPGIEPLLEMIDLYREKVVREGGVHPIRTVAELDTIIAQGEIGTILSLEGVDGLEGSFTHLRTLFSLGVRFVGITWNHANWAADGVMEPRQGGFTSKGRRLIAECEKLGIVLDVSHLTDNGFWELVRLTGKPFIASHSNARSVCAHPRNLNDAQIDEIVRRDGRISLTFVPWFLKEKDASVTDLLRHIEHFCSRGAAGHIGFGSDFDGFKPKIPGLENPSDYPALADMLLKHYREDEVRGMLYGNWHRFLRRNLPE